MRQGFVGEIPADNNILIAPNENIIITPMESIR